jgi:hypothetical protein
VTTTDDLRIDDLGADLDAERQTDVSMLLSALSPLAVADIAPPATVRGINEPECRSTRAALHDYLNRRLRPRRRRRLETHLDGCTECIRTFIDIREAAWTRRAAASSATPALAGVDTAKRLTGTS